MNSVHYSAKIICRNVLKQVYWVSLRWSDAKPLRNRKSHSAVRKKKYFTDFCYVTAVGGKGGDGMIAFLKLWKNPLAGPCGGDGGSGGHVIFQASSSIKSLERIPPVVKGERGEDGKGKSMHGANGIHTVVEVPVGTVVKRAGSILIDLNKDGEKFIASRGGAGGHGNQFFLSDKNRHPEVAEIGADGETNKYILEMKIIAHVGLVGFPNAGKSTLLRAISRASPKVASYPFTTLNPHVGIVHYDDYVQIAVADLPGLIPGAHENRGLGISFLKHIERCICILFVIDLSDECPWKQLDCLKFELEQYQAGLSQRPHAIVANKCDLPVTNEKLNVLQEKAGLMVYPISAKYGNNVRMLLDHIRDLYDAHNKDVVVL